MRDLTGLTAACAAYCESAQRSWHYNASKACRWPDRSYVTCDSAGPCDANCVASLSVRVTQVARPNNEKAIESSRTGARAGARNACSSRIFVASSAAAIRCSALC